MSKQPVDEGDFSLLSDEEKQQLMESLENVADDLQKKRDEVVDMESIRQRYGEN
jgi:hypothetical protein